MKLPFSFGISLLWRMLIPGAIFSAAVWPLIALSMKWMALDISSETVFAILTIFLGSMFVFVDMQIYMLAEGRRYWPDIFHSKMVDWQQKRLCNWISKAKAYGRQANDARQRGEVLDASVLDNRATEYWLRAYRYPLGDGSYSISSGEPNAMEPTELGNVIAGYETYGTQKYGLDGVFFWNRLLMVAPKEVRNAIQDRQALCDGALYSWFASSVGVLVYACFTVLSLVGLNYDWPPGGASASATIAAIFFVFAFLFWCAAISVNEQFGDVIRSMTDAFVDLAPIEAAIDVIEQKTGASLKDASSVEKRRAAWRYLKWHKYRRSGETENEDIERVKQSAQMSP